MDGNSTPSQKTVCQISLRIRVTSRSCPLLVNRVEIGSNDRLVDGYMELKVLIFIDIKHAKSENKLAVSSLH
ncbi:MAG: hypothetical protein HLUCCA11_23320 [Phormidesmis priestleyi Ana]|uniref:Uncharacterized protein n=1 Tax=Phormidesmis priestleyi Ana TaxID=1666911 RepID=A0A0P8BSF3_9CYAN|nr:MAG: hypothetical protein HLUCCA11_23320 [Phormidesmis priestleyi Ana]